MISFYWNGVQKAKTIYNTGVKQAYIYLKCILTGPPPQKKKKKKEKKKYMLESTADDFFLRDDCVE